MRFGYYLNTSVHLYLIGFKPVVLLAGADLSLPFNFYIFSSLGTQFTLGGMYKSTVLSIRCKGPMWTELIQSPQLQHRFVACVLLSDAKIKSL